MKLKELPNTVVHCKTKDEYDRLMKIYEEAGWTWFTGTLPTAKEYWGKYHERTIVDAHDDFGYCDRKYSERKGERIISLSDFLREQGIEQPLKAGDWVEVVERFDCDGVEFAEGSRWQITDYSNFRAPAVDVEHLPSKGIGQLSSRGKRSWVLYPDNLKRLRKCSPPPTSESLITISNNFIRPLEYTFTWDFSPDFISSPIPPMSITDDAVSAYRHSKLNPVERRLRKAGFKDEHGNWTDKAVRTYMEMLLDGDGQKVLDPIAKTLLKKKDEDDE